VDDILGGRLVADQPPREAADRGVVREIDLLAGRPIAVR